MMYKIVDVFFIVGEKLYIYDIEKRYTVMMYKFVGVFFIVGEKIYSYDVQIWWYDFIVGEKIYSYEVQHCSGVFHSRRKDIQLWYANLLLCFLCSEKSYTVIYSYDV